MHTQWSRPSEFCGRRGGFDGLFGANIGAGDGVFGGNTVKDAYFFKDDMIASDVVQVCMCVCVYVCMYVCA